MPDWVMSILSKVPTTLAALTVFIATGSIFFAPKIFTAEIGIVSIRDDYRTALGLAFLLSSSFLLSQLLVSIKNFLKPFFNDFTFSYVQRQVLKDLTEAEKSILRPYINDGQAEQAFRYSEGTVNLLERKKVLARASNMAVHHDRFHYILQPWARTYLKKNMTLLDKSKN